MERQTLPWPRGEPRWTWVSVCLSMCTWGNWGRAKIQNQHMHGLCVRSQFWRDPKWSCLCLFVLYCVGTMGPAPETVVGLQHKGTVHIPAAGETGKQEHLLGRPIVWAKGIHFAWSIYKYFPLASHYPDESHRGEEKNFLCCVHVNCVSVWDGCDQFCIFVGLCCICLFRHMLIGNSCSAFFLV